MSGYISKNEGIKTGDSVFMAESRKNSFVLRALFLFLIVPNTQILNPLAHILSN
jgi:hypothetical protein